MRPFVPATFALIHLLGLFLFPRASEALSAGLVCSRMPGLTAPQRALCRSAPGATAALGDGLRTALLECQHQFRAHRWNCSAAPAGRHLVPAGSREAAFSRAIQAAGAAWAVAAACGRGSLAGCGCAPGPSATMSSVSSNVMQSAPVAFKWAGCLPDLTYAMRVARRFLDGWDSAGASASSQAELEATRLMDRHNSKAGRKALQQSLQTDCKCHGVSGSCSLRTCWKSLPSFRRIGDRLMAKYHAARAAVAVPARLTTRDSVFNPDEDDDDDSAAAAPAPAPRRGSRPALRLALRRPARAADADKADGSTSSVVAGRAPRRSELVFLQGSPNYCDVDPAAGLVGTAGRTCSRSSSGADGCDLLCCGRGYNTHQVARAWQCHCRFNWCCSVQCEVCFESHEEYTCK